MATNRHPIHHPHRGRLNHAREMTLLCGVDPRWDAFRTEEEFRDAWMRHRDRLLAHRHGRRPMGWWRFESPIPFPGQDRERAVLFEAGLLDEEERAELVACWREHFERAQDPQFMFCVGFAKPSDTTSTWLKGAAARRAHYRWSGIPKGLVREWTAQRRRRGKIVRKQTTATEEPAPAA
jgi:hypothetical protein